MDDSPPVVADETVYASTEGGIVGRSKSDGSKQVSVGDRGRPVARVGDTLYAIDGGTVRTLDAAGGGELWSYETEAVTVEDQGLHSIYGYGVTPVNGAVYVRAADALHGFGPRKNSK